MSSSEILFKSKEIVESSKLEEHEALVSESVWVKRVQIYMDTCTCIKRILANKSIVNNVPSPYTLILLGGILGNTYTTCKLCIDNTLLTLIEEVLNMLLSRCNVESVRNLLLLEPIQSSKLRSSSNLASQILKLCVSHLAKTSENSDDSLTKSPLFRDTLIWLTMELDYPELAGDEFISILQPLGLRLTEDYRPCIQSAGLSVLRNLAHKARIADWRQSNRAEAVISHLLVHRIANSSDSSEALLDEVYSTLLLLTSLLDVSNASHWYNEITERLLFDLLMENRYKRQIVLLQHLLKLINILKASFSLYTQQFTRIVSHILLGPQKPKHICNDQLLICFHLACRQARCWRRARKAV
ncbi:unnamed protein product [Heterobilharzia americana]|nr:unnamed protein product [Heterobilharzia americana]